ncbi:MAG: hypothetical protein ACI9Y7_001911 [Dokdonia sp.]|jgi:hypothetical protein
MKRPLNQLIKFSEGLRELKNNPVFLNSFSFDTGYSKANVIRREIVSSADFIKLRLEEEIHNQHFSNKQNVYSPKQIQKAFCLLPGNAPLYAFCAKVLVPCMLYDIDLTISFPSRLKTSKKYLLDLFSTYLPSITIIEDRNKGELFNEMINNSDVDTIIVFASDEWIGSYIPDIVRSNKRLIFEGPGNDPCVVFEDYKSQDVGEIAKACLNNSGQSCSSIKRVYVNSSVYSNFIKELESEIDAIMVENPDSINSIKSPGILTKIESQINEAKQKGAKILYGDGKVRNERFYPTIVLSPNNTSLVLEENFFAVTPVVVFDNKEELETMIFESDYGLNCSLFGNIPQDFLRTMQDTHKSTFVNSTVVNPKNYHEITKLGGFKRSGFIIENGIKRQDSFCLEDLVWDANAYREEEFSYDLVSEFMD